MTIYDYLRVLRRGWLLIVATTLLGLVAGLVLTLVTPPSYAVRATVIVSTLGDTTPAGLQQSNEFAEQRVATYAGLAGTDAVLSRAASTIGDDVDELRRAVTTSSRLDTSLIDIDASGDDPVMTAQRANAVATTLAEEAVLVDAPSSQSPVQLTQVSQAEVPTFAVTPRPRNNVFIGLVVGLVLGIGLVIVAQALDTRIRTMADLPRGAYLATTTSLPTTYSKKRRGGSVIDARLESFRNLRANLLFGTRTGGQIAVAGVTASSNADEVARQLAQVLGEIGQAVVVVDVDLHPRSRRHNGEPTEQVLGVADVLEGNATSEAVIQETSQEHVSVVGPGHTVNGSPQLLSTVRMQTFLAELAERFDYVVIACPPLVARSDSVVAAALAGSSLVVVEAGVTNRSELLYALELLDGVGVGSVSLALDHVRVVDLSGTSRPQQNELSAPARG